jgi:hypothetical protein
MRRWLIILIGALTFGAVSGVAAYHKVRAQEESAPDARWREIAWPYPRDAWPAGRAFRCDASSCGGAVEVYVRPKVGFCNCEAGVADDDEVDRVADLDLISERFSPRGAGRVVHLADLSGRARDYELKMSDGSEHGAIGIALSHHCDLLVAVAQGEPAAPDLQRIALAFLASGEMHHWMMVSLGGR